VTGVAQLVARATAVVATNHEREAAQWRGGLGGVNRHGVGPGGEQ